MNPAVLALQEALFNLGLNPGPLDGRWGPATRSALRRAAAFSGYGIADLMDAARTVYGEARGESYEGKRAVAQVIVNRARSYPLDEGKGLSEVCRRPWQFSCWNAGDPNRARIEKTALSDPTLGLCLVAVVEALSEPDPTGGATHYHATGIAVPKWAQGHEPCYRSGGHLFYRGIA